MKYSAKALALTGGGTRGLYSSTVIAELEKAAGRRANEMFDLFAGTSVGGMIAIGLSLGISADEMSQQIIAHAKDIFGYPAILNPKRLIRPKHDPARLVRALEAIISRKNLRLRLSELPVPVILPAVSLTSNEIVYFSGESKIGNRSVINSTVIDALLSTTAAPTYYPPHVFNGRSYIDGGVAVNSPDVDALFFCRSTWFLPLDHIRLLSVGTGYDESKAAKEGAQNFGGLSWLNNHSIISRMIELQENSASALAQDLLSERYCRVNSGLRESIDLDEFDRLKLESLAALASREISRLLIVQPSPLAQFLN